MTSKANLLKNYPNFFDLRLPHFIGCLEDHDEVEAKQAFQRVCFKDVFIAAVKPAKSNCKPACIWRIYYQLKNKDTEFGHNDTNSSSDILPPKLPMDEGPLRKLYEDITAMSSSLGVKVLRKLHTSDGLTAIVEYFPIACECEAEDFNMATEEPRMWPVITENMEGLFMDEPTEEYETSEELAHASGAPKKRNPKKQNQAKLNQSFEEILLNTLRELTTKADYLNARLLTIEKALAMVTAGSHSQGFDISRLAFMRQ